MFLKFKVVDDCYDEGVNTIQGLNPRLPSLEFAQVLRQSIKPHKLCAPYVTTMFLLFGLHLVLLGRGGVLGLGH